MASKAEHAETSLQDRFCRTWLGLQVGLRDDLKRLLLALGGKAAGNIVDDALQETFRRLFNSDACKRIAGMDGKAFPYLRRCCRNTAVDLLRKQDAERRFIKKLKETDRRSSETTRPSVRRAHRPGARSDRKAGYILGTRNIFRYIREAPSEKEFSVFRPYCVEGLPAPEVAAILDITPNNVHQISWRIRRKLKTISFPV